MLVVLLLLLCARHCLAVAMVTSSGGRCYQSRVDDVQTWADAASAAANATCCNAIGHVVTVSSAQGAYSKRVCGCVPA